MKRSVPILALFAFVLLASGFRPTPASVWKTPTPTPTSTAVPPVLDLLGPGLVDVYRITTDEIWHVGHGSVAGVMLTEPDALVMARVAMGESPSNLDDRIYILWLIRLRAELGFKEAGANGGYRAQPDRWGPSTSIKRETLCDGGCQFEPVRATEGIYFPANIKSSSMRGMVAPDDGQLVDFHMTYLAALAVLARPLSDFPQELRGYDAFRSPSIDWYGARHRAGGLRSRQFFPRAHIWRDEYPQDNEFWKTGGEYPSATPEPTATSVPATPLLPPTPSGAIVGAAHVESSPSVPVQKEETMDPSVLLTGQVLLGISLAAMLLAWLVTFVWVGLFKQEKPSELFLKWLVFGSSSVAAFFIGQFALPSFPALTGAPAEVVNALLAYLSSWFIVVTAAMKIAQAIYDYAWVKFLEAVDKVVFKLPFLMSKR